ICPQKLKIFWLTVSWNPLAKASVTIITATLMTVATVDSLIINLEKDFCWLNAMRFAMNAATFNLDYLSFNALWTAIGTARANLRPDTGFLRFFSRNSLIENHK